MGLHLEDFEFTIIDSLSIIAATVATSIKVLEIMDSMCNTGSKDSQFINILQTIEDYKIP